MKNRLARIKTTLDDQGRYNEQQYFKQQQEVYSREINFAIRTDAITEKQFGLKPIHMSFMNYTVMNQDSKFKQVKKIMTEYNKGVLETGEEIIVDGMHLRKNVMESMLKFMTLMMLAPDTKTKKIILDIAHFWFIRQLDPKIDRKTTQELDLEIKNIVVEKKLLPIQILNRELILNQVNQQLRPYKARARTMYKQLDDPKVQLEKYNIHQLEFVSSHSRNNLEKQKQKKWIDTVKFLKIQPLVFTIEESEEKKENTPYAVILPPEVPGEVKLDAQGNPLPQPNVNDQPQADLDFGQPPGDEEPEAEEFQENQDKKRGKLDPLLKNFVLERIRNKQKGEVASVKIRQKQINRTNIQYEQDFLSADYVRQWAKQRARIKTQIAKKHQNMKRTDCIYTTAKPTQFRTYLEKQIDQTKIHQVISQNKKNITFIDEPSDKLNAQQGLSLFDRRRVKTQTSQKPFSRILNQNSRKEQQPKMLEEIMQIKDKFSNYKLYTPLDKLIKGLAPPEEESEGNEPVVWPNSTMLSNPYFKVAKKKKKKKKK